MAQHTNLLECFEVDVKSQLGLEFVWQETEGIDVTSSAVDTTSTV